MFKGASALSLDTKGRFAMPTKYRQPLLSDEQGELVCTIAINEPCLWLYPQSEWDEIAARLVKLSNMNPRARRLQRMLVGHATEYQLDKNGRILLSPTLRQHAGLSKKIMLIGLLNKFEIWDEARWHQQMQLDTEVERNGDFDMTPEFEHFSL